MSRFQAKHHEMISTTVPSYSTDNNPHVHPIPAPVPSQLRSFKIDVPTSVLDHPPLQFCLYYLLLTHLLGPPSPVGTRSKKQNLHIQGIPFSVSCSPQSSNPPIQSHVVHGLVGGARFAGVRAGNNVAFCGRLANWRAFSRLDHRPGERDHNALQSRTGNGERDSEVRK